MLTRMQTNNLLEPARQCVQYLVLSAFHSMVTKEKYIFILGRVVEIHRFVFLQGASGSVLEMERHQTRSVRDPTMKSKPPFGN